MYTEIRSIPISKNSDLKKLESFCELCVAYEVFIDLTVAFKYALFFTECACECLATNREIRVQFNREQEHVMLLEGGRLLESFGDLIKVRILIVWRGRTGVT